MPTNKAAKTLNDIEQQHGQQLRQRIIEENMERTARGRDILTQSEDALVGCVCVLAFSLCVCCLLPKKECSHTCHDRTVTVTVCVMDRVKGREGWVR